MKRIALILLLFGSLPYTAATLIIEGKFQNKNLFVQNGYGISGVGYCVKEVKVNGNITTDETNSSSFEIDLKRLQLKYGQSVTIELTHSDGCIPKVLNMEDLKPRPTFEVLTMSLSQDGILTWKTKNENGVLPFVIEQFKWNKWVPVGTVDGLGTAEPHDYTFKVTMHSGTNKYRIKQKGYNNFTKVSKDVISQSTVNAPKYTLAKNKQLVDFSSETAFEIYNAYGQVVKKGFGKQVEIANLEKGAYYLCFDNLVAEIKL